MQLTDADMNRDDDVVLTLQDEAGNAIARVQWETKDVRLDFLATGPCSLAATSGAPCRPRMVARADITAELSPDAEVEMINLLVSMGLENLGIREEHVRVKPVWRN
jgi:hypothetical protein